MNATKNAIIVAFVAQKFVTVQFVRPDAYAFLHF
jgi:hypothetical protein